MNTASLRQLFRDTDFVRTGGSEEELRAAEILEARCRALGVEARIESFPVPMGEIQEAQVLADGEEIPCKGFFRCGSGCAEGELYYMPGQDPVSIAGAAGKIVLMDTQGIGRFTYRDLVKAGAKGILFQYGRLHDPNRDIDQRELREHVRDGAEKLPCAMIHAAEAVALVKKGTHRVRILVRQREYEGRSRNVVARIPGETEEWILLSAHYDSTSLSHGAYDNMSGCAGLLGVMEALRNKPLRRGLCFVFCGSEERGLLGSKAFARDHEAELEQVVLNVNLDMIGSVMGKFIACVSGEEGLKHYLRYLGAELGFPLSPRTGVYSSDSTSFADKGVPAVSLARVATDKVAPIHCRHDDQRLLSMEQLKKDIVFISEFTRRMAQAAVCPVSREMPEKIRKELDEYLGRRRKEQG